MQTDAATASTLRGLGIPIGSSFLPVHTIRRSSETPGMLGVEYFSRTASIPHSFDQLSAAARTRDERHMAGHVLGKPHVPPILSRLEPLQTDADGLPAPTRTQTSAPEQSLQTRVPVSIRAFGVRVVCHAV